MNKQKFLITGVNGFIGRHLVKAIRSLYPDAVISGLDNQENTASGVETYTFDLMDQEKLTSLLASIKPDIIFHLAGVINSREWSELYRGNVEITVNLLEAVSSQVPQARVIIPGSAAEYGGISLCDLPLDENTIPNPVVPYGVSKAWQTMTARYYAQRDINIVIGRLFNLIGEGISENLSIGAFVSQLNKIAGGEAPPLISVGNLEPKRDFLDIEDACKALLALAQNGERGQIYNICSGTSVSMLQILQTMIDQAGLKVEVRIDPTRFKQADIPDIYGSHQKLTNAAGWQPTVTLEASIKRLFG